MSPELRVIQRRLAWIRHAQEVTNNVAKTCRYFGISRTTYYRWHERYRTEGERGLQDRSRRPHSHPKMTPGEVVEKVLYLRRYYHFGPARIRMYLQRYHAVSMSKTGVKVQWFGRGTKRLSVECVRLGEIKPHDQLAPIVRQRPSGRMQTRRHTENLPRRVD